MNRESYFFSMYDLYYIILYGVFCPNAFCAFISVFIQNDMINIYVHVYIY